MDAISAYKLIVKTSGVLYTVRICKDLGDSYIFALGPYNVSSEDPCYMGKTFTGVDKQSGKIFSYDIIKNRDSYKKAKIVRIRTGADLMVSELDQMAVLD